MGFQSQAGQVGIRFQASKGTYANPGAVSPNNGVFMRHRSGSLTPTRSLIIPDPEIGGNRDVPDAYLGPVSYSGSYDFYARMRSLAFLLKGVLGVTPVVTNNTDNLSLAYTPADGTVALPWMSVEEALGSGLEVMNYTDAKINSLHLEAAADGYLMGTVGIVALTGSSGNSRTAAPAWDTTPLYIGSTIDVKWNAVSLSARSFSMDIANNLEDNDFRLGSVALGDIVEKRREFTFSTELRPNDAVLWKTANWGSSAATGPQAGASAKGALTIIATSYELIPGADTEFYKLTITVPVASMRPFQISPSGDDVITNTVEFQALRPNPATPIMTATVVTDTLTTP